MRAVGWASRLRSAAMLMLLMFRRTELGFFLRRTERLNFVGRLLPRRARPLAGGGGRRRGPSRGEGAEAAGVSCP